MPSPDHDDVATVVRRYRRLERGLAGATALGVVAVGVGAVLALPLVPGLLAALAVGVAVRAPVFRTDGRARLVTDADPMAVREAFAGARPPPLAFQWASADSVRETADGAAFDLPYLFGLRSVRMETHALTGDELSGAVDPAGAGEDADHEETADSGPDGTSRPDGTTDPDLELLVTAGGRPWGAYAVSVRERGTDEETVVDLAWESGRHFGLRRLPAWLATRRYRDRALAAQGYAVAERDGAVRVWPW